MNAKHYGSGINLEMTTHIIFYHRMNGTEKQVIGRDIDLKKKRFDLLYLYENEPEVEKSTEYQYKKRCNGNLIKQF